MNRKQQKNCRQGRHSKRAASKLSQQSDWKRIRSWFLVLTVTAITTFVTANFTNLGNLASNYLTSLFSSTGLSVQIDSVRARRVEGVDIRVFANPLRLSNAELSHLNSLNETEPSYDAWFTNRGAVDTDLTQTQLTVEGNRNYTVRVIDIQPIVTCQTPLNGTLFYSPPGGADGNTKLLIDLDHPLAPPAYSTIGQDGTYRAGKDFFGTYTISLNRGEQFIFNIVASTKNHFCKFTLAMTVLDRDKTITESITNNGQPFQVTALLENTSRYQDLYVGGLASLDLRGNSNDRWIRANPKTFDSKP